MGSATKPFRKAFNISNKNVNWFPGHMNFSFKHMQAKMRMIECVVEVHDSRIPFSGRNPLFLRNLVGTKPHILVLNKKDLIDSSSQRFIEEKLADESCDNVVFTNCLNQHCKGLNSIVPLATSLIRGSAIVPRERTDYKMMVVGVPNVGKSSFINALRNVVLRRGKATAVGGMAGVTRKVQNEVKVSVDPPIYLIDTPGILTPNILDVETGMKLALCSCVKDEVVGVVPMADFLLYWMNKIGNFSYVKEYNLKEPIDEIFPVLLKIAVDNNKMRKVKNVTNNSVEIIPDINFSATKMISQFRKGCFGDLYFDSKHFGN